MYLRGSHYADLREINVGTCMVICVEIPSLVKIGQKCWKFYVKAPVRFIVAGDIKPPYKLSLRVKSYVAVRIAEEVKTLRERATV
jgi:hypothetical protein